MIEGILNERIDIFLPQPSSIKQDAINLSVPNTDLMLPMLQDQQTKVLKSTVFAEIGVADRILLIVFYNLLTVIWFIAASCINNKFYFILDLEQQIIAILRIRKAISSFTLKDLPDPGTPSTKADWFRRFSLLHMIRLWEMAFSPK